MNTPVQPPPGPPPTATSPPVSGVTGSVVQAAAAATEILNGGVPLPGTIASLTAAGQATIRTDSGALQLQLSPNADLPRGASVTLLLDPATGRVQLALTEAPSAAPPPTASPASPSVITALTQGSTVTATVTTAIPGLAPAGGGAPVPGLVVLQDAAPAVAQALLAARGLTATVTANPRAGLLTLQSAAGTFTVRSPLALSIGSPVQITPGATGPGQVFTLTPLPGPAGGGPASNPTGQSAPAGQGAQTGQQAGAPQSSTATGVTPSNTPPSATLTPGAQVPFRIATITPPGGVAPPNLPPNSAAPGFPVLEGLVIGQASGSAALVRTPAGVFSVPTGNTPFPEGTRLALEIAAPPSAPISAGGGVTGQSGGYAVLQELVALLQQADPAATRQAVQVLLPTLGPQLASGLLFLLQALRIGGAPRWLGPQAAKTVDQLRRGTVDRLDREMASLRGRAVDGSGGEWRTYQLPVLADGAVEALRLYTRDRDSDPSGGDENDRPQGQRFVIEINFTRLGPYQFDTLVRDKHLDLMVRTQRPIPEVMRRGLHDTFTTAVEALGLTGTVGYHVVKAFDLKAAPSASGTGTIGMSV